MIISPGSKRKTQEITHSLLKQNHITNTYKTCFFQYQVLKHFYATVQAIIRSKLSNSI